MFILQKAYCYEPYMEEYTKQAVGLFQKLDHELSATRVSGATDFEGVMLTYTALTINKEIKNILNAISSGEPVAADEFMSKLKALHVDAYPEVIQPYYEKLNRELQFTEFEKRLYEQYIGRYMTEARPDSFFERVCDIDKQNEALNYAIDHYEEFKVAEILHCEAVDHDEVLTLCKQSLNRRLRKYCDPEFMQELDKKQLYAMMLKDSTDELIYIISYLASQLEHAFHQKCIVTEDFALLPVLTKRLARFAILDVFPKLRILFLYLHDWYDEEFINKLYLDLAESAGVNEVEVDEIK